RRVRHGADFSSRCSEPPTEYGAVAPKNKKARQNAGLLSQQIVGSGRLFLGGDIIATRLGLGRLRTATRALGERALDLLDGFRFGDLLHRRNFARQAVERRLIELTLGIGLLRLILGPVQVPNDLGN